MGKRRPNWRLVKLHRNYTVEEAAAALGRHPHTVRNWLGEGLPCVQGPRPQLILGPDLADFIRTKYFRPKQSCARNEFFCVRCTAPKVPAGEMADYVPLSQTYGNLRGICPTCDRFIYRRAALVRLETMRRFLDITIVEAEPRLRERCSP